METSQWPRIYPGASALLFERLVDDDPRTAREPQPFRTLTIPEVRASVRREVARLLNTRCAASAAVLAGRERTVLDYGIPDCNCPLAAARRGPAAPGHPDHPGDHGLSPACTGARHRRAADHDPAPSAGAHRGSAGAGGGHGAGGLSVALTDEPGDEEEV